MWYEIHIEVDDNHGPGYHSQFTATIGAVTRKQAVGIAHDKMENGHNYTVSHGFKPAFFPKKEDIKILEIVKSEITWT